MGLVGMGIVFVLLLGTCIIGISRRCRYDDHVQLKETDDSGMPPQIVGAGDGLDNFVIGEDDEENEHLSEHLSDDAFEYVQDAKLEGVPRRHQNSMEPDAELQQLAPKLSKIPPARLLSAGDSIPIFSGPMGRGADSGDGDSPQRYPSMVSQSDRDGLA